MVTRLVGGLTPEDGSDPRTFPAIFNDAVDDIEAVQSGLGVVESGLTSLGGTVVTQGSAIFVQGEAIAVLEGTAVALGSAVFDLESDLSNLELGDLADVTIGTAVADGNVLAYSTAVSGWVNAVAGGGKILQVVRATDTTQRTTSNTTYVDANISVSITPQSASSNILVIWQALVGPGNNNYINRRITDSSNVALSGAEVGQFGDGSSSAPSSTYPVIGFVAASDTSARTYKGRFHVVSAGTATLFNNLNAGQIYAIEIGA
jgi:hypothetical protein